MRPYACLFAAALLFSFQALAQVRQSAPAAPPPPQQPIAPPASATPSASFKLGTPTALEAQNAVAIYLEPRTLRAVLKSGQAPLAGKTILFTFAGMQVGVAPTDAAGLAKVVIPGEGGGVGDIAFQAKFPGDATHHAAEATGKITVMKAASKPDFQAYTKAATTGVPQKMLHVAGMLRADSKTVPGLKGIPWGQVKVSANGILIGLLKADGAGKFQVDTPSKPFGASPFKVSAEFAGNAVYEPSAVEKMVSP